MTTVDMLVIEGKVQAHTESITALDVQPGLELKSDEEMGLASEMIKDVKRFYKEIDAERQEYTKPLNAMLGDVNGLYQPVLKKLTAIEAALKVAVGNYTRVQQEKQRAMLAAAAAEAASQKTREQAEAVVQQALQVAQATPTKKVEGVSVTEVWDFELVDTDQVPRQYLAVDATKVKAAIKAGVREIPGLRIFSKASVRVTT